MRRGFEMIKKTLDTIKSNPKVLLVFTAAILLMSFGVSFITLKFTGSALTPAALNYDQVLGLLSDFLVYLGILLVFALAATTLVWPALGNYIHEMCTGKLEKGWYLRGLKKSWWKVPLLALIIIAITAVAFIFLALIFAYVLRAALISLLLNLALTLTISVYSIIALTAVFVEDEFSYALGNVFSLGGSYFFKLLGVAVLVYLPFFLISLLFSYITNAIGIVIDNFSVMYFILQAVNIIYSAATTVFILTYSMHRYLDERSIYYPPVSVENEQQSQG